MYPYYRFAAGLTVDDIAAVRALYGPATAGDPAQPPTKPPSAPDNPPADPPSNPPAAPDTVAPSLRILSPGFTITSTSAASIRVSGSASDNVGVVAVRWSVSTGSAGDASGTSAWTAQIPLLAGTNAVTVRAYDAAGNSSWRAVTVVRR